MTEVWKDVPGYEGHYQVSDQGRVLSLKSCKGPKLLKISPRLNGRLCVVLYKDGKRCRMNTYRIVLTSFVGPRPEGYEGCHGNGDFTDNRIENLRWDTHANNCADTSRHGHVRNQNTNTTHCIRDHELSGTNLYVQPDGKRMCKTCRRLRYHMNKKKADVEILGSRWKGISE